MSDGILLGRNGPASVDTLFGRNRLAFDHVPSVGVHHVSDPELCFPSCMAGKSFQNCHGELPPLADPAGGTCWRYVFPLSMLNNLANINYLALSGPPKIESQLCLETTFPQIKSLALQGFEHRTSSVFRTWAKRHITGLQSLKYDLSCYQIILDVFKICSDTLENLCLCFRRQGTPRKLLSRLAWHRAEIFDLGQVDLIDLSSLPHLCHLTIHVEIFFWYDDSDNCICSTYLPKAVEILETVSSLHQLTIEIYVDPANLNKIERIDLSPLGVLTKSSVCFPHIDLYIYTGAPWCRVTPTIMDSLLAKHKGLMELVELGVLAVHPEETAPTLSRSQYFTVHHKI